MEEEKKRDYVTNHFEAGSNCQVFNGPVNGCVFAMPGSNVTQQNSDTHALLDEKYQGIVEKLKPIFYGVEEDARAFLASIQGVTPRQLTDIVTRLVKEGKISELSCHRPLWKVLHDCGIYDRSESNWNIQVG